ncbi:MAG: type II/IV secretion system protein, partial [Candidatus Omnitrophica bacterium]|nr:type II/IV secretion system protein [Candidatus Omnitrophota bacterium]
MQAQTVQRVEALMIRLRDMGIASPQQIEQARQEQVKTQERFGAVLARLGIIREADGGKRLAAQLGWLPRRLEASESAVVGSPRIPVEICRTHRIVPIQDDASGHVVLATDDPLTAFSLEWLERRCGVTLDLVMVREQELEPLLMRPQQPPPAPASAAAPRAPSSPPPSAQTAPVPTASPIASPATPPKVSAPVAERPVQSADRAGGAGRSKVKTDSGPSGPEPLAGVSASDEPVIRLVDSVLSEAVRMRASDVHIEPLADRLKVRYRIDGVLHDVNSPPKPLQGPVISRIKIMGGLNIAEKRLPQDGRLQLMVEGRPLDVRISILPALHGEAIVMRLLDRDQSIHGLNELGMAEADQQHWEQFIHRSYGMILVTGPTGSGKTTTLYATLAALNRPDRKLITVEDPVEYQMPGVNQVQVRVAVGLSFAAGLRSMLRQAPDVIMVGEIRDQETAQIAIQAALTGHL